jgi:hypothetical protein
MLCASKGSSNTNSRTGTNVEGADDPDYRVDTLSAVTVQEGCSIL